jgi:IS4 transposase
VWAGGKKILLLLQRTIFLDSKEEFIMYTRAVIKLNINNIIDMV